jgi:hypothetical protein
MDTRGDAVLGYHERNVCSVLASVCGCDVCVCVCGVGMDLIARKSSKEDVVSQPLWTQRRHPLLRRGPQRATQATLQRAQAQTPAETGHSSLRPQPSHHSMVPCTPQPARCQFVFLKLVFFKFLVQTSSSDGACTQLFVRTGVQKWRRVRSISTRVKTH